MHTCKLTGCERPVRGHRRMCSAHEHRVARYGSPDGGGPFRDEIKRFLEKALTLKTDACVEWPYGKTTAGYGHTTIDGREQYVHRYSCERHHGPAPSPSHEAAHSCRNTPCFNGRHLRWATSAENKQDTRLHGKMLIGESHPNAKLTNDQVSEIRASYGVDLGVLAARYGVSRSTIIRVRSGRGWKSILTSQGNIK